MKTNKAVIYAESLAGYRELCSAGRELADEVVAIVVGSSQDAAQVAALGVPVRLFEQPVDAYRDDAWPVLCAEIVGFAPELVLIRASVRGLAFAGALAVATGMPVASGATAMRCTTTGIEFELVRYGGATVQAGAAARLIAVVGAGQFASAGDAEPAPVTVIEAQSTPGGVRLLSRAAKTEERVDLAAADVVVGVGRGIGSEENVAKAGALAAALGGELACSRPIAEGLGWLAKNRYLGVSGVVVQPEVYLALGISGQVQHLVGVQGSKAIVAINKDPKAPIFAHCDLGLVADLETALPALLDELR